MAFSTSRRVALGLTLTSEPKLLRLTGYQICLPIVLRELRYKLKVTPVIYFPFLSRRSYKKDQELQDPKCIPHLSVAGIRISLSLFDEKRYSVMKRLIRSFEEP